MRAETGLVASVGVAPNKLLAKLASDDAKPDGMLVVEPGGELAFLHPHPVGRLWGVGPATLGRLERFGVESIGDLAALPEASLIDALGRAHGHQLHELASGRDDRPVEPDRETKSIGQEETFPRDVSDREVLRREVLRMAERVGAKLRDHDLAGRTVTLKVRFPDFRTITRSATLPEPFSVSAEIARLALGLLEKVDVAGGIRLHRGDREQPDGRGRPPGVAVRRGDGGARRGGPGSVRPRRGAGPVRLRRRRLGRAAGARRPPADPAERDQIRPE